MPTKKPYANEPGCYRVKLTKDGAFVLIDYALRLKKSGAPIMRAVADGLPEPNTEPWVIWHPASDTSTGFPDRKAASKAFNNLVSGKDVLGMLSSIRGGDCAQPSKVLPVKKAAKSSVFSPAHTRARKTDLSDYPKDFNRALAEKFPPELLMSRLEEAMTAESPFASQGMIEYRPDWTARLKAWECAAAYLIGRPIERQQILQSSAPMSWESILGLAKSSPVFRDTLLGMLKEMEQPK